MSIHDGNLTSDQLERFFQDGYLVIPNFFDAKPLLQHAKQLISQFPLEGHPLTKFSTGGGDKDDDHVGDRYFLESGDKIRYFFEQGALDSQGTLLVEKHHAINKCGHGLHLIDPTFREFSFSKPIQKLTKSINVYNDPKLLQSMIICKQPEIGGKVPCHNDSTFLYTNPLSAIGFWFALEDCTQSNGCLSFLPGSHRWPSKQNNVQKGGLDSLVRPLPVDSRSETLGQLRGVNTRFVRKHPNDADAATEFQVISNDQEAIWDDEKATVEECLAGSLVLIHGSVLHKSEKNLSNRSRYIYTFHMIEGDFEYDEKNWLQPTIEHPFPSLYSYST